MMEFRIRKQFPIIRHILRHKIPPSPPFLLINSEKHCCFTLHCHYSWYVCIHRNYCWLLLIHLIKCDYGLNWSGRTSFWPLSCCLTLWPTLINIRDNTMKFIRLPPTTPMIAYCRYHNYWKIKAISVANNADSLLMGTRTTMIVNKLRQPFPPKVL